MSTPNGRKLNVPDYRSLRPMIRLASSVIQENPEEHPLLTFTLLTYNILAQNHIHREGYPYCGKDTLKWSYRRNMLNAELCAYEADIMCFQEMDRFHDYFLPLLDRLGYDARYYMRSGPGSDVNCVCWRRDRFKLLEGLQVSFEGTTTGMGAVPNVAQFVALQSILDPRLKLAVATTHLYWKVEFNHVRLVQLHSLLRQLLEFSHSLGDDFIHVIAGDLNSDYTDIAIRAILRTTYIMSPDEHRDILKQSQMPEAVLRRILADFTIEWPRFYDAYGDYASAFPGSNGYPLPYTTFCMYKGILDFILYSQPSPESNLRITPTALLTLPDRSILESEVALPNKVFASDHLALMTEFTLFHRHLK